MNINQLVWTQLSLDDALKPYFDDPSVYLTDDPGEIARRQRELTCLMENPKLAEAFEQLAVRFDELEALRMTTGADAKNSMRILRSIVALKAFQKDLAEIKAVLEQSTEFTQDVELIDRLFENFPEDYSALWARYEGASLPESMTYRMEVDSMFNIETYRLIAVHGKKYKIPLRAPWASRGYYWLTEKTIMMKKPDEDGDKLNPYGALSKKTMNPYMKDDYVDIIQQGIQDLLQESSKSASNQLNLTARVLY